MKSRLNKRNSTALTTLKSVQYLQRPSFLLDFNVDYLHLLLRKITTTATIIIIRIQVEKLIVNNSRVSTL